MDLIASPTFWILAPIAVILVGIAKAGFGGGVGIAAVPIFITAVGDPKVAVGMMLPVLCVCDWFSLYHYRQTFDKHQLAVMLPGCLLGIAGASFFIGAISAAQMKFGIGIIALLFVIYQVGKEWLMKELAAYRPSDWHGWLFGFGVGVTSTFAHAAGPVATMYLFPQKMGRRLYVGTTVVLFTLVNATKLIPYTLLDMLDLQRLSTSLLLLPFVPVGTLLGVWMNKHMREDVFSAVIYGLIFLAGINYTLGWDPLSYVMGVSA